MSVCMCAPSHIFAATPRVPQPTPTSWPRRSGCVSLCSRPSLGPSRKCSCSSQSRARAAGWGTAEPRSDCARGSRMFCGTGRRPSGSGRAPRSGRWCSRYPASRPLSTSAGEVVVGAGMEVYIWVCILSMCVLLFFIFNLELCT